MKENKEEQQRFTKQIEHLVISKRLTYIEAIVCHCETTGLEIEVAAKLINRSLKKKLREEGMGLNLIPKPKTSRLPI